jgi:hypothetical protein
VVAVALAIFAAGFVLGCGAVGWDAAAAGKKLRLN